MIKFLIGKKKFQKIFEYFNDITVKCMNFGGSSDFNISGELNVFKFIKNKFSEEPILIFDVGAHTGNYSTALYNFFKEKATIHAFEPAKKTYIQLLIHLNDNKQIIANNFGFSDSEKSQILYSNEDCSGLASVYKRKLDHLGCYLNKLEKVKLSTIDIYCKTNNINRIHFLKLDIEGHELNALNGATQMLNEKKIDVIQFEFGGCNIDSRTFFRDFFYLLKKNYKIYRILKDGLLEISIYKEQYEIFDTINYLAVKTFG
jgi:FkbM family methyltransferase